MRILWEKIMGGWPKLKFQAIPLNYFICAVEIIIDSAYV